MALSLSYYDIEQMAAIVLGDKIFVIRRNFRWIIIQCMRFNFNPIGEWKEFFSITFGMVEEKGEEAASLPIELQRVDLHNSLWT